MTAAEKHLQMLGKRCKDKVTGLEGVIASISFDLYGCIQGIINPPMGQDGKLADQAWFDIARLEILDDEPVMQQPDFVKGAIAEGGKGPANKPIHKA